jgi:hypothetical protein
MTLAAGTRLGPYEILSPLGAGGMGEVYRARDRKLDRDVAIKVLPAARASDSERVRRFEKEAKSASALNHPNIVTIYEVGSEGEISYIVMEHVEGQTLSGLLLSGAMPLKKLLATAIQIAEGLAKAHEAGFAHRDLKPENVMVTKDGTVKILDFGLAKLTSTASGSDGDSALPTMTVTTPGVVVGTVGYMSPEQASGLPLDFRSDQFSFGSVLYEMATGKRAFAKKTGVDTLGAILNEEPQPIGELNPQVPAPLRWIVERCLAKQPEERYVSTKDLARELSTVRDHLSETSGVTEVALTGRPRRRASVVPIAAATLALGLLAGRFLWNAPAQPLPTFRQLTFREETIQTGRFAPDGQTIVYGVVREGNPFELLSTRVGSLESRSLGLQANIGAVSSTGEMALILGGPLLIGTLAQAPLAGGAPREILENAKVADWSPDGRSLAAVHVVGSKERLECPIGTVLFESTDWIGVPRFARGGDRILFENRGAFSIVEPKTKRVRTLRNHVDPFATYAWSPRGDEIWTATLTGVTTELRALVPDGPQRLLATLPGRFFLHDVEPGGRILVERVADRAEMWAQAPGEARERRLSWLDGSVPVDISWDGRIVLFNEEGPAGGGHAYLRKTDGSDAVRLGEGQGLALSPDARWTVIRQDADTLLVPTGPGESRKIIAGNVEFSGGATFFPDSQRVLLSGKAAGIERLYEWSIESGEARPVGPDGVSLPSGSHTITPDGKFVAARQPSREWAIYSLLPGTMTPDRPIVGLRPGRLGWKAEQPVRWTADGRRLYVPEAENGVLSRLDPVSGRRETFKQLRPRSIAYPTPDGSAYVYGFGQFTSNLWLIEGLR